MHSREKKIIITNRWQKIIPTSKSIGNFCILREKYICSMYQTVMNSIFDEINYKKKIFTLELIILHTHILHSKPDSSQFLSIHSKIKTLAFAHKIVTIL